MRAAGLAAIACVALALGGDGGSPARPTDAALATLSVPFLASADDTGAAVFHAWTSAGPVVVMRDGAIASRIGAGGWRKASTHAGEPLTVVERFVGASATPRAGERSSTDVSVLVADAGGRASVEAFDSLDLGETWPGVHVTLRARAGAVEKVFVVAPGASPE